MSTIHRTSDGSRVRISKAKKTQVELLNNANYVSINDETAFDLDLKQGQQLRIYPEGEPDSAAAYTIFDIIAEGTSLRMAKNGRKRVGKVEPFDAVIDPVVPRTDLTYSEAWEQNEVWETGWYSERSDLLVLAPHGVIESNTAQAASLVYKHMDCDRVSGWFLYAWGEDAFDRWHITTNDMSLESYPGLARVARTPHEYCVSFHVWNGDEVLIGGLADQALRNRVANAIQEAINGKREVVTDYDEGKYMATSEANIVNSLTADGTSGVQIEMTPTIARNYRKRVARAVADVFDNELSDE